MMRDLDEASIQQLKEENKAVFSCPHDEIPRKRRGSGRPSAATGTVPHPVDEIQMKREVTIQQTTLIMLQRDDWEEFKVKSLELAMPEDEPKMGVPLRVYKETPAQEKTGKRRLEGEKPVGKEKKKRKAKKQKKNQERVDLQEPTPDLPQEFKDKFQELGYDEEAVLVIKKELYESDLKKNNNRFSIPEGQIRPGVFLAEEEQKLNCEMAIEVKLIDPSLRVSNLNLKKWEMKNSAQYVLITKWYKEVVQKNPTVLKNGNVVQLWAARHERQLCFALVPVREARNVNEA